jgi:hypothetical protein
MTSSDDLMIGSGQRPNNALQRTALRAVAELERICGQLTNGELDGSAS